MTIEAVKSAADDARKMAELILAGIMTPAIADTAAELVGAGALLKSVIVLLAWLVVGARLLVIALELRERYFGPQPNQAA